MYPHSGGDYGPLRLNVNEIGVHGEFRRVDSFNNSQGGGAVLIAQGLAEYGALSGGGSSLSEIFDRVDYAVRDMTPATWVTVFAVVLVVWFVFFRSR
jgi:hypothetical protein